MKNNFSMHAHYQEKNRWLVVGREELYLCECRLLISREIACVHTDFLSVGKLHVYMQTCGQ